MGTMGTEQGAMPAPMQPTSEMPAQMPTPEPMQPTGTMPAATPEVERMQIPMQSMDSMPAIQSGMATQSGGMTMQMGTPAGGGSKKIMIIIGVIVAGLIVGGIAFFVWRMNQPSPAAPVAEQPIPTAPVVLPPVATTTVTSPVIPQPDNISVIEADLNTFNVGGIDAELQGNLNNVSKSL